MQELVTREIAERTPSLYATEEAEEPIAQAHFFSCANGWDWYMTELDPETGEAFGLVRGFATEWGYFSIREMEELNRSRGFNVIERDAGFEPQPASRFE